MWKFAICDDEPWMLQQLAGRLAAWLAQAGHPGCPIRCFLNGQALLADGCDFDMIFLDVQMPPPDGLQTARQLRQRGCRALLVFVSVLRQRVFDAFAVEPFDYLLKPLEAAGWQRTMARALQALERRAAKSLFIPQGSAGLVLPLAQLVYCEVQGRKLYLHRDDGQVFAFYERLTAFEQRVDGRFFRCHRSYLVNLDCVRGCAAGQVLLPHGGGIPLSRLREQALTQALLRRIKECSF